MEPLLIIRIIKLLCPYLKDMAARTDNAIDDALVDFVCQIAGASADEEGE